MKYGMIPTLVEAFQMTEESSKINSFWPEWLHLAWNGELGHVGSAWRSPDPRDDGLICVGTPDGPRKAHFMSWIIRRPSGALNVVDAELFAATFSEVRGGQPGS